MLCLQKRNKKNFYSHIQFSISVLFPIAFQIYLCQIYLNIGNILNIINFSIIKCNPYVNCNKTIYQKISKEIPFKKAEYLSILLCVLSSIHLQDLISSERLCQPFKREKPEFHYAVQIIQFYFIIKLYQILAITNMFSGCNGFLIS